MIITVCLNPAVDKMVTVDCFVPGETNRVLSVRRDPGGKGINVAKIVRRLGGDTLALGIVARKWGSRTILYPVKSPRVPIIKLQIIV